MDIIRAIEQQQINPEVASFNVGDTVKVHYRIKEGDRERIQVFQGDVIRRHGASNRETSRFVRSASPWAWSAPSRFTLPRSRRSKSPVVVM